MQNIIYADFDYYPLVWYFSTYKLINKTQNIKKRSLQILYDNLGSNFS